MRETMLMNMKQAISNVLELMFFLPVQFIEDDCLLKEWLPQDQRCITAALDFSGPVTGSFFLFVPADMAKEITANFLGFNEEEISGEQERDTVKEALNMIGGHMLSLVDETDGFQLGIPEIIPENVFDMTTYEKNEENIILIETEENNLAASIILS